MKVMIDSDSLIIERCFTSTDMGSVGSMTEFRDNGGAGYEIESNIAYAEEFSKKAIAGPGDGEREVNSANEKPCDVGKSTFDLSMLMGSDSSDVTTRFIITYRKSTERHSESKHDGAEGCEGKGTLKRRRSLLSELLKNLKIESVRRRARWRS